MVSEPCVTGKIVLVSARIEKADPRRNNFTLARCPLCITRQVHDCNQVMGVSSKSQEQGIDKLGVGGIGDY